MPGCLCLREVCKKDFREIRLNYRQQCYLYEFFILVFIAVSLGFTSLRFLQNPFLAIIFPFSESKRGGKRGSINLGDYWALGVNSCFISKVQTRTKLC